MVRLFQTPLPIGPLPLDHLLSSKPGSYHLSSPAGSFTLRNRFFSFGSSLSASFCGSNDMCRQTRSAGLGVPSGSQPGPDASGFAITPSLPSRYAAANRRPISAFLPISESIS